MTSAAFASLAAPAFDDSMELSSSPAGNHMDDDIDIDVDYYDDGVHVPDDEHMLDDGEPARPATATDDMMDDNDPTLVAPINEEEMHDGPDDVDATAVDNYEDELIDYDEADFKDPAQAPASEVVQDRPSNGLDASTEVQVAEESAEEEIVRQPEQGFIEQGRLAEVDRAQQVHSSPKIELEASAHTVEATSDAVMIAQGQGGAQDAQATDAAAKGSASQPNEQEVKAVDDAAEEYPAGTLIAQEAKQEAEQVIEQAADVEAVPGQSASLKPLPQLPGELDTNLEHVPDGPPTPTDTGLHPMTIKFGEHEMPLFKSRAQPTGLLKDDNLVSVSLADLIHSCRKRLSLKLGESHVPEGQDLVLNFELLGMMLFEGSRSASSTSLSDIIDVFLALHRNDGNDEAPPLVLSLQPQPFATMFEGFKRAAEDGTGLSHFLQPTDVEDHVQDQDGEDGSPNPEDQAAHDDDQRGDTYNEDQGEYQFDFQDSETAPHEPPAEASEQGEPTQGDDEETQESHAHDEITEFEHGEYPGPEDDLDQYEDDGAYDQPLDDDGSREGRSAEGDEAQEVVLPESTASSYTVRGDAAHDGIDASADDGHDDFSALLAGDDDAYNQNSEADLQETEQDEYQYPNDQANAAEVQSSNGASGEQVAPGESEAFLNDNAFEVAEQGDDLTADLENYYDDQTGDDLDFTEGVNGVSTDNAEQSQDNLEPSEDTEQFHTALDLLDGTEAINDETGAGETAQVSNGEDYHNDDDLHFDDDDYAEELDVAAATATATGASNSPLGKRSFEEHADEDEFDPEEPDLKKVRSD